MTETGTGSRDWRIVLFDEEFQPFNLPRARFDMNYSNPYFGYPEADGIVPDNPLIFQNVSLSNRHDCNPRILKMNHNTGLYVVLEDAQQRLSRLALTFHYNGRNGRMVRPGCRVVSFQHF